MNKLINLLFLILLVLSCKPQIEHGYAVNSKIVGGIPTDDFPGVVAITHADEGQFCSGVAVSPHIVFTAAHCLFGQEASDLSVYVGAGDRYGDYVGQYQVASYDIHSGYDDELSTNETFFDFAYIVLADPLNFDEKDYIVPLTNARLLKKAFKKNSREEVILMGYGRDEKGFAGQKRMTGTYMVEVHPYEFDNDSREEGDYLGIYSKVQGACKGDSGGPAFMRFYGKTYLVGIAHSAGMLGDRSCRDSSVNVTCLSNNTYGRIDIMMEWFLSTLHGQDYQAGL